jgi:hypothetical protein
MIRSFTAILLVITILASNFTRLFVYAGFELNQKYIATRLCVNRDKPMLHCNGKCYLAKKLKQAAEKEKSQERENQKSRFQEALPASEFSFAFASHVLVISRYAEPVFALAERSSTIYQPPRHTA